MKHKFKVGDRVKILQSAEYDGINSGDLGREAIVEVDIPHDSMYVRMVAPRLRGSRGWWVRDENLIPVVKVGEQLEFAFMKED